MAARKIGSAVAGAVGEALLGVAARALGSAVESILEDVSGGLKTVDEKVSRTKKKVGAVKGRKKIVVEAEVVDDEREERRH